MQAGGKTLSKPEETILVLVFVTLYNQRPGFNKLLVWEETSIYQETSPNLLCLKCCVKDSEQCFVVKESLKSHFGTWQQLPEVEEITLNGKCLTVFCKRSEYHLTDQ